MKTEYKYFELVKTSGTLKTDVYNIVGKRNEFILGRIKWYGPWRQYCLHSISGIVLNTGCLTDIQHFIKQLMDERKDNKHG